MDLNTQELSFLAIQPELNILLVIICTGNALTYISCSDNPDDISNVYSNSMVLVHNLYSIFLARSNYAQHSTP